MSIDIINEPTLFFIKRWHIVSVAVSSPHNLSLSKTATPIFSTATEDYLKEELNNYFNKISKELNTDIDCFSNKALSHFNTKNEWENYNWKEKFPTANFHLNVKANVVSGQMITKT